MPDSDCNTDLLTLMHDPVAGDVVLGMFTAECKRFVSNTVRRTVSRIVLRTSSRNINKSTII